MILSVPHVPYLPQRIISLVPSQTELLFTLGLDQEIIGITKFCKYPAEWFKHKTRVGGTKTLNISLIKKLNPDLVIANKEENEKQQVELVGDIANTWVTDVSSLDSAITMLNDIGKLCHKSEEAASLALSILKEFSSLPPPPAQKIGAAYLIWKDPYMVAGGGTFIEDMMTHCGLKNIFSDRKRYPEITTADLMMPQADEQLCELLILSSEPYPFAEKHIIEMQEQLPNIKIVLADGEMFSWYGSRLLLAPAYFNDFMKRIRT
ncbi:MAG: helical backbone metal receptor [Ginsengibacter sp.]